ncbi:MAG: flagellar FliJ family protein [Selenomonadaceae bacterium]
MKKFKFQLETLLKVTKMRKDQAEVSFAESAKLLEEQREQLILLNEEMKQGLIDYNNLTDGKRINVGTLMTYNSFFAWKREQLSIQANTILQTQAEKKKRLKELTAIMNKLKSIEQIRQKRLEEFKTQALQEEQKFLDEVGLQLTIRAAKQGDKNDRS